MPFLEFKRTVDIGNLLTVATIALSALGLFHVMNKDRDLQVRDQANEIRISASDIIQRVDRLATLPLLSLTRLQSTFVETSELVVKDGRWDPLAARDFLWKPLSDEQERMEEAIYGSGLNVLTGHFFAYDPGMRERYNRLVHDLQTIRDRFFGTLFRLTQDDVLYFMERQAEYQTAQLGNRLRASAESAKQMYVEESNTVVRNMIDELTRTVGFTDLELIERTRPK